MSKKIRLLIIGSSQGVYGGIEAFMMTIAKNAKEWPEFSVKLCYKLKKGIQPDKQLSLMAKNSTDSVHYVEKGSKDLIDLIKWAQVMHIQNAPPDIVIPGFIFGKSMYLTVHNRKMSESGIYNSIWSFCMRLSKERWYNSNFVMKSWEGNSVSNNSYCIPTVCNLPSLKVEPSMRKGFLFMGRWIDNKGIEELLLAYSRSEIDKSKWPLTILGNGPIKDKIFKMVQELNLETVLFPGFVTDDEKEVLISQAKWMVAPANTKEDLGLTPIEARSVGVPSIVSNDGGLPESGGPSALIVIPGDIDSLKEKLKEATEMSEEEYIKRSRLAEDSLKDFLKPIDFYRRKFVS